MLKVNFTRKIEGFMVKLYVKECIFVKKMDERVKELDTEKNIKAGGGIPLEELNLTKPRILLHSCCGPCSTAVIERLVEEYSVTVFFYNPNITEEEEYTRRLNAQKEVIDWAEKNFDERIEFIEGSYNSKVFFDNCREYKDLPEGSRRCEACFSFRLEKTAEMASLLKFDSFTTTLTVSPRKNKETVNKHGKLMAAKYQIGFLEEDFKRKAGFQRSVEISKLINIYRQQFCGCIYSK